MIYSDGIIDITLRVRDAAGREIVLSKDDIRGLVIDSQVDELHYRTGGPFAPDGRIVVHDKLVGIDHSIVITLGYYEFVPNGRETTHNA